MLPRHSDAADPHRLIRVDQIWLTVEPMDMRAGSDRAMARVVKVPGRPMVSYEAYMQIKILHKQGKSLRDIVCEVGYLVNTVRKYLAARDAPTFRPASMPRESILRPFEAYLRERIAEISV